MKVSVRLFASLREALGTNALTLDLPEGATAGSLADEIRACYPRAREFPEALVSVNYEYVASEYRLREGDEVALIPPVSGGALPHLEITEEELTAASVELLVRSPECGAVTVFLGAARRFSRGREVEYLEYEAYPEMAVRKLRQIVDEVRERWGADRIAVRHRVGRVELGEASVAIAVATEHRAEGFAACKYVIDRLKEIVPIWKREVWVGGGEWVGWDCAVDPSEAVGGRHEPTPSAP